MRTYSGTSSGKKEMKPGHVSSKQIATRSPSRRTSRGTRPDATAPAPIHRNEPDPSVLKKKRDKELSVDIAPSGGSGPDVSLTKPS